MSNNKDNTGDCNTGYRNTGYCNTGDCNTGDCNTGDYNTGGRNTGYCNTGGRNIGDCNTGDYNTGYCNTGDYNTGYFNTNNPNVRMFNQDSGLDFEDDLLRSVRSIIRSKVKRVCAWVHKENMTDQEKDNNPSWETTGGYLKTRDYQYCWEKGWENMEQEEREIIQSLPNFCPKIFEEITGINVKQSKKKVTLELTAEQLDQIQDILNNNPKT